MPSHNFISLSLISSFCKLLVVSSYLQSSFLFLTYSITRRLNTHFPYYSFAHPSIYEWAIIFIYVFTSLFTISIKLWSHRFVEQTPVNIRKHFPYQRLMIASRKKNNLIIDKFSFYFDFKNHFFLFFLGLCKSEGKATFKFSGTYSRNGIIVLIP